MLDVGCRSRRLQEVLCHYNPNVCYVGVDLNEPAEVIADLNVGLPFGDKTFDVVVALDVLEHTDNIHRSCDELFRVAGRFVVITLPNAYELRSRAKFLIGRTLSGKYGLPVEPPADRHRWLFSLTEAKAFIHVRAARSGFEIREEGCLIGPRRASQVVCPVVGSFPNLFSTWYLILLNRRGVV